jgi:hypothetical protein
VSRRDAPERPSRSRHRAAAREPASDDRASRVGRRARASRVGIVPWHEDAATGVRPTGTHPMARRERTLRPDPRHRTRPIAPARGWPENATPTAAEGLEVRAFARGLDHPRWLLRAAQRRRTGGRVQCTAPQRRRSSALRGWVMAKVMKRAGAGVRPARIASRCCATPTATASPRHAARSSDGSALALRHGARRRPLYVANTDAVLRYPYAPAKLTSTLPASRCCRLPAAPINHHWTKNLIASPDGRFSTPPSARTATSARTAWRPRRTAPRSGRSTQSHRRARASVQPACATPTAWRGSPATGACGSWSTSATSSAATSCPTT